MKIEVYQIFDSNNKFIYNVAIKGDIISLFKYKKDNNINYKYLDIFNLEEKDLKIVNDDLYIVEKELIL